VTRRRPREASKPGVEVPPVLLRSGIELVPLVPADVLARASGNFHGIVWARQLRDVARVRFRELTGAGHASWRVYPVNVSPAVRRAGERLAEELARL
jgi:hypothetical protein